MNEFEHGFRAGQELAKELSIGGDIKLGEIDMDGEFAIAEFETVNFANKGLEKIKAAGAGPEEVVEADRAKEDLIDSVQDVEDLFRTMESAGASPEETRVVQDVMNNVRGSMDLYDPSADFDGSGYIVLINEIMARTLQVPNRDGIQRKVQLLLLDELAAKKSSLSQSGSKSTNQNVQNERLKRGQSIIFEKHNKEQIDALKKKIEKETGMEYPEDDIVAVSPREARVNPLAAARQKLHEFASRGQAGFREKQAELKEKNRIKIGAAKDFPSLYAALREIGIVPGGLIIEAERIQKTIEGVRKNIKNFKESGNLALQELIINSTKSFSEEYSLRAKVRELLMRELSGNESSVI